MEKDLKIDKSQVVISIRNLKKSFGDVTVLNEIDIDVFKGENLVVLGKIRNRQICFNKNYCRAFKT